MIPREEADHMTTIKNPIEHRSNNKHRLIPATLALLALACAAAHAPQSALAAPPDARAFASTGATNDAAKSAPPAVATNAAAAQAAFLRSWTVFNSPRCRNCHPSGDAPLQGDDSHVHIENDERGPDGHGLYGMNYVATPASQHLPVTTCLPAIRNGVCPPRI